MFKWKVSGLGGGGSKKSKSDQVKPEVLTKLNNGQTTSGDQEASKNVKTSHPANKKDGKQK